MDLPNKMICRDEENRKENKESNVLYKFETYYLAK